MLKKRMSGVCLVVLTVATSGCGLEIVTDPRTREVTNVKAFLEAVSAADDTQAQIYLDQNVKDAVQQSCPSGSVISCFDIYGRQQWGDLQDVIWEYGVGEGKSAYITYWKNATILIFIESRNWNGIWIIQGWRGVTPAKGGWPKGVLSGENPLNQFPPPSQTSAP